MNLLRLLSLVLDHPLTTALRQGLELPPRLDQEPYEGGYRSRSRGWGALGYRSGATAYATGSPGYRSYVWITG